MRVGSELLASIPGLRPPTVDGFTMDAETWMGLQLYRRAGYAPMWTMAPPAARAQYDALTGLDPALAEELLWVIE